MCEKMERIAVPRRAGRAYPRGLQHPCRVHIQPHHLYRYREGRKGSGSSPSTSRDEKRLRECKGRPTALRPCRLRASACSTCPMMRRTACGSMTRTSILAKRGATVASNPASNEALKRVRARAEASRCGMNVALGTDGMASNNNRPVQDMYLMGTITRGMSSIPIVSFAQAGHRSCHRGERCTRARGLRRSVSGHEG